MSNLRDKEYRLTCFGRQLGRWHLTRKDAASYAVKRKLGSYDEARGVTFLDVSASIIARARRAEDAR